MKLSIKRFFSVALLLSIAACNAVSVQTGEIAEVEEASASPSQGGLLRLRPYSWNFASAGSDAGDVGLERAGVDLLLKLPTGDAWFVEFKGKAERSSYSIPGLDGAIPTAQGVTVSDFETYQVGVNAAYMASDRFAILFYGMLTAGLEQGADFDDSVRGTAVVSNRYALTSDLGVQAGVAAFTRLERDSIISPILGLDWRPNPRWEVFVGLPETKLTYRATDQLGLSLTMGFEFYDFRLDQPGALDDGVLTSELVTLGLSTEWTWSDYGTAWLMIGQPIYRELKLLDSSGATVFETSVDAAPFVGIGLELRF